MSERSPADTPPASRPGGASGGTGGGAPAWIEPLADFLRAEPGLTGLRLEPDRRRVSLRLRTGADTEAPSDDAPSAPDQTTLQVRLTAVLRELDQHWLPGDTDTTDTDQTADKADRHDPAPATSSPPTPAHPPQPGGGIRWSRRGGGLELGKVDAAGGDRWREFKWPELDEAEADSGREWRLLAFQAGLCGVALITGWLMLRLGAAGWLAHGVLAVSLVSGGWDAAKDAWQKIRRARLDIHFLMLAVAVGAVSIGAWTEGALLLFLFSLSGALEHYAMHRTHREIGALARAAPKQAHLLLDDGTTVERGVHLLRPGQRLQVRPDELFPVDGRVLRGESAADESNLTGEAAPVPKAGGAEVFSGTLNLWGVVEVEVTRPAAASALQKIIALIHTAQQMRAPSQRFTDRFGTGYTLLTLGLVTLMFFVWWLWLDLPPMRNTAETTSAFYRAMTLLVVMSPCALVLSIPSAILAAIAWGARRGVLFRGGAAIEKLAEVDTVAMDKTGTLTEGAPVVRSIESFPAGAELAILQTAVTLEAPSNHPIARAIRDEGRKRGIQPGEMEQFRSITGQGVRAHTSRGVSYAGRRELLAHGELAPVLEQVPDAPLGVTEVWVLDQQLVGRILLHDRIREGSRAVLRQFAREGVRTVMLTGDRRAAAAEVAGELGIDEVRAGLHPEDKVAAIRELGAGGHKVAMVGDGVNDAPSLAAAYVSVAMGARGSDAAAEQSDVVLMQDKIEKLLAARLISRRARAIIRQNLTFSLGSVGIMAFAALFGVVPLTLGVITHEGSTVLVCLNSLRLLFVREPGGAAGGATAQMAARGGR